MAQTDYFFLVLSPDAALTSDVEPGALMRGLMRTCWAEDRDVANDAVARDYPGTGA